MEFEATSELLLDNESSKGGLVEHDAQFVERRIGNKSVAKKDSRSLYEQIAEQRSAAEELKKASESKAFKPRGLDEEEADFLGQQEESRRGKEEETANQEELDRRAFELAVSKRQAAAARGPATLLPAPSGLAGRTPVFRTGTGDRPHIVASSSPGLSEQSLAGLKRARTEPEGPIPTSKGTTSGTTRLDTTAKPVTAISPPACAAKGVALTAAAAGLVDYFTSSSDEDGAT